MCCAYFSLFFPLLFLCCFVYLLCDSFILHSKAGRRPKACPGLPFFSLANLVLEKKEACPSADEIISVNIGQYVGCQLSLVGCLFSLNKDLSDW